MDSSFALKYYSRPEIQKAILDFAKDREIGVMFDGYFGKRPDVIENLHDVKTLVDKGVFSFHSSEERWVNPLLLGEEKSDEDRNKNRAGWDLILDLDGVDFELSKIVGKIIIEYLNEIGVKNVSLKFSGNKGFHIGVPFEAFSTNIIGIGETRNLFPDVARRIAALLIHELGPKIAEDLLKAGGSIEEMSKKYEIDISDLKSDDEACQNFNWMKIMEIDTILISSRHLFRMPYSLNEKSQLVSVPIKCEKIMDFQKTWARPQGVKPDYDKNHKFLKYDSEHGKDADILLIKAYEDDFLDKISQDTLENLKSKTSGEFVLEINEKVDIKDFPQTIQFVLNNNFEDGRKRAIFLLLTYLYSIKWDEKVIEELVKEWNSNQETPLKANYVMAQNSWFKIQQKPISPPNFNNDNYYKSIGIPQEIIEKDQKHFKRIEAKNPLHHTYLLLKSKPQKK
jgi:DNA primase catalytic subunit